MIIAARTFGLDPVDGPFVSFKDSDWYETECVRAKQLGAVGKWAIHPSQIAIAQKVFSPTQDEVDRAYRAVAAYRDAQAQGLGAIQVDGQMVDVATVRLVQRTIDQAELAGIRPSEGI
jgi:citrate lyase subunit beta/citryl-CoA lyase